MTVVIIGTPNWSIKQSSSHSCLKDMSGFKPCEAGTLPTTPFCWTGVKNVWPRFTSAAFYRRRLISAEKTTKKRNMYFFFP